MIFLIWRLFPFRHVQEFSLLYILGFTGMALGLIYLVDFLYRKIKKKDNIK